ncbi:MAG: phosphomannomutase CpsG, partial [Pseudomonadota bacterium]|nr:phosphomannomutase CpsG [Pseudomonadota bacterium]
HHYFRDFAYCDSGMIPWLLVAELLSRKQQPLSELVSERIAAYPSSGEINLTVSDAPAVLAKVEAELADSALTVEHVDGVSVSFADWRFNLRASNTEPVIRLNVESRGDVDLMHEKTQLLVSMIKTM